MLRRVSLKNEDVVLDPFAGTGTVAVVVKKLREKLFPQNVFSIMIEKGDEEKKPIYLETSTEKNVKMYERYGFEVPKKITLPVIDLPQWEMWRVPNSGSVSISLSE